MRILYASGGIYVRANIFASQKTHMHNYIMQFLRNSWYNMYSLI